MVVAEIKIRCKNSNCSARPTIWTKTFKTEDELALWTFAFEEQEIECPTCHTVAVYCCLELSAEYSVTDEPEPAGLNPVVLNPADSMLKLSHQISKLLNRLKVRSAS